LLALPIMTLAFKPSTVVPLAALVLGVAWFALHARTSGAAPSPSPAARGVPVTTAQSRQFDFPVYLTALGFAQPLETVTVTSQVDGTITRVLFEQGQLVKQGDPLVEIDAAPFHAVLDKSVARRDQDQARLDNERQQLARYEKLADVQGVAAEVLERQRAMTLQIAAQLRQDKADLDEAQIQLARATLRAPFTGRAGFRLVDAGNVVRARTTEIVKISKVSPIAVVYPEPEELLPSVRQALAQGTVRVDALSVADSHVLATGRLLATDGSIRATTGTVDLKAEFDNPGGALWPSQAVAVRTLAQVLRQAVVVPGSAVQHGPEGLYAYVVDGAGNAHLRTIEVSHEAAGVAVVSHGLKSGETVVTEGHYRLEDGAHVVASAAAGDFTAALAPAAGALR
jgi:multidrug efflux system membrane fusion protein